MSSTDASALPFTKATPLPDVQALDETQWQQQREAMLACIAAEDRRRAEAAQQVVALDSAMNTRNCTSRSPAKFLDLQLFKSACSCPQRPATFPVTQVPANVSADAESAASIASTAPPAESSKQDTQPGLEADLDSNSANTSNSHEVAGYAESSSTESDQDVEEDSDYVAESDFSQDASSYADSEEDYMGEEQVLACSLLGFLRAHNQKPVWLSN